MEKKPNILFVLLDTTRRDVCSLYGHPRRTTPVLDALAAEGLQFEQAIAPAPWTLPTIASIFTGRYPGETGVYPNQGLDATFPTLAELLASHGYGTYMSTMNSWCSQPFGLQRGFQTINKQWQLIQTRKDINRLVALKEEANGNLYRTVLRQVTEETPIINAINLAYYRLFSYRRDTGANRVLKPFQRWITKTRTQAAPWFAFIHYMEAHLEYRPPVEWLRQYVSDSALEKQMLSLRGKDQWRMAWRHMAGVEAMPEVMLEAWRYLYEAEVAYVDYHMGQLLDWLRASGEMENTLVVVVADHGENHGEHGLYNHQYCLYEPLIRVPYVLHWKGQLAPAKVDQQVLIQDIFGTLLDAAGVRNPGEVQRSHLQIDHGPCEYAISEYGQPRMPHPHILNQMGITTADLSAFERGLASVRTLRHKVIIGNDGSVEAYDMGSDPDELKNIADVPTPEVTELTTMLQTWLVDHPIEKVGVRDESGDKEVERRLRDLGYVE